MAQGSSGSPVMAPLRPCAGRLSVKVYQIAPTAIRGLYGAGSVGNVEGVSCDTKKDAMRARLRKKLYKRRVAEMLAKPWFHFVPVDTTKRGMKPWIDIGVVMWVRSKQP